MGLKVLHPQEVEVFYILPSIRKAFAEAFKAEGWKQSRIAEVMGVTESAVSQYLKEKRAMDVTLPDAVKAKVHAAAKKTKDQSQFVFETQQLLDFMLKTKATCDVHRQLGKDVAHDCNTCFERTP